MRSQEVVGVWKKQTNKQIHRLLKKSYKVLKFWDKAIWGNYGKTRGIKSMRLHTYKMEGPK